MRGACRSFVAIGGLVVATLFVAAGPVGLDRFAAEGRADDDALKVRAARCSWSFFADPRAVLHGTTALTGCVTVHGVPVLVRTDVRTGASQVVRLFGRMEVDDHNNPALIVWHRRLWAFVSPHSGHLFPLNRHMFVHYRASLRPFGVRGGFGRVLSVPLPTGCGDGYTYPNLVVAGARLFLFLRGPCLQPIYTSTADGRHWTRARTLVLAPRRRGLGRERPYAKYAAGPGGISMIFTDGHPYSHNTSLYYARLHGSALYRADGSLLAPVRDLPLPVGRLDPIYHYRPATGRVWPMDVAVDRTGRPAAVYTRSPHTASYWYARWNGHRWTSRRIEWAGGGYGDYGSAGATLNHTNPSEVALAHNRPRGRNEIEVLHTLDGGRTWQRRALTAHSSAQNLRPIFPRGSAPGGGPMIEWVAGASPSFRHYQTWLTLLAPRPDDD